MAELENVSNVTTEEIYDAMGDSSGKEWADRKSAFLINRLKKSYGIRLFVILSVSFVIYIKPDVDDWANWFARSGSLLIVLAALTENYVNQIQKEVFRENSHGVYCQIYIEKRFAPHAKLSKWLDWSIGILGTIIWGYGDLIWKYVIS